MRKLLSFFLLLFSCTLLYSQINVDLKGLSGQKVVIWKYALSNPNDIKKDTLLVDNDQFSYPISDTPTAYAIIPSAAVYNRAGGGFYVAQSKFIELFSLPNETISIKGELHPFYTEYAIDGNELSSQFAKLRLEYLDASIAAVKADLSIDSLQVAKAAKEEINSVFKQRNAYFTKIMEVKEHYVQNNLDKELSAYLLLRYPLESFASIHQKLDPKIRSGIFKHSLADKYASYEKLQSVNQAEKNIVKGNIAPSFELTDIAGKAFHISKFKGKYIILDFWGSWCGPCIQEIPQLKSFYDKYKNEIVLVGIACNERDDAWKRIVNKENMNWHQLLNSTNQDVSVLYGIKAFPTKVVIDKDYKILKTYVGSGETFFNEMAALLN
ncbi:TlpA family protein disulfide reductase [Sphingobacteruim zhuxiongii]|nr:MULTISPECIES: TlpA disulfide reductase family protein [unclassified Sphingobacterium]